MSKCYYELRTQSARGTSSTVADTVRHFHTRQRLGKGIVFTDQSQATMPAARKEWLRLTRHIQKRRSSTVDADKIMKYTREIGLMQRIRFTMLPADADPDADMFFVDIEKVNLSIPAQCCTVYVYQAIDGMAASQVLEQLPADALIVDYTQSSVWSQYGAQRKSVLESYLENEWQHVCQFLARHEIDPGDVATGRNADDVLDELLGCSEHFLRLAGTFQRSLELARPLRLSREARAQYDWLALLAYRVQALSPGSYAQHFLDIYNEDDTFFLRDNTIGKHLTGSESIMDAADRHEAAGRFNLARSLRLLLAQA